MAQMTQNDFLSIKEELLDILLLNEDVRRCIKLEGKAIIYDCYDFHHHHKMLVVSSSTHINFNTLADNGFDPETSHAKRLFTVRENFIKFDNYEELD